MEVFMMHIPKGDYQSPFEIFINIYELFCTVQPDGMPLTPVVQLDIDAALTNVPFDDVQLTQLVVQSVADISVARHLM